MLNTPPPPPPFPILESIILGLKLLFTHARLFLILSFFPFIVMLLTLVAIRLLGDKLTLFFLPVVQLPSSFIIGLQCALILRFIVLQEYPLVPEGENKAARNRAITHAAVIYTAVTYFLMGLYAGLLQIRAFLQVNQDAAGSYMPIVMAIMVLLIWGARWFWLHVPVALEWPVSAFYTRIGKWVGSLRVFALFALCSLLMNFVTGLLRLMVMAAAGPAPGGFAKAFDDGIVAAATLMLAMLFTTSSAAAVKIMAGKKVKDIEA
jgi:hypothetical protein